jgi:hypothetical protein
MVMSMEQWLELEPMHLPASLFPFSSFLSRKLKDLCGLPHNFCVEICLSKMEGSRFGCVPFFPSRQQNQIERSAYRNPCLEKARGCLLKCAVSSLVIVPVIRKKSK